MNILEQQLHYPLANTLPAPGSSLEIAPGVRWIRMSLPFALDHINLWLLRDCIDGRDGWTVVDCCIDHPESRAQWHQIFDTQLQGLPVLRVIVTHMHPDHIGLAHWLCELWTTPAHECRLWISATDYYVARVGTHATNGFGGESAARYFASHGMGSPEALAQIEQRSGYYRGLVPDVPRSFRRLSDGGVLHIGGHDWHCISGYGHAPEHIALHCPALNLLISGDMVLPRISTNVSVYDAEPEGNALAQFLESIGRFVSLPEDTLTLPSHGKPFTGLHKRVQQLHDHHRDRLAEVLQACSQKASSAHEVLPILFKRPLDLHQSTFAMGESVAHLNALWLAGELRRESGADGVWRFARP